MHSHPSPNKMFTQNSMPEQLTPSKCNFHPNRSLINHEITRAIDSTAPIRSVTQILLSCTLHSLQLFNAKFDVVVGVTVVHISHLLRTQIWKISCSGCGWAAWSGASGHHFAMLEVPAVIFVWHYEHKNRQTLVSHSLVLWHQLAFSSQEMLSEPTGSSHYKCAV